MDDQALMGVMDRRADRPKQFEPTIRRKQVFVAISIDRQAFDVFHHQIRQPVVGRPSVEQPGDVRMIKPREGLTLPAKAADDLVCVHPPPDQLDRDLLLELSVGPDRVIDRAHPARCDHPGQLVGTDAPADLRRLLFGGKHSGKWNPKAVAQGRRREKRLGLLTAGQQRFDFFSQRWITLAGAC